MLNFENNRRFDLIKDGENKDNKYAQERSTQKIILDISLDFQPGITWMFF